MLSEEHLAFQASAERWVRGVVRPALRTVNQDSVMSRADEESFYRRIDEYGFASELPRGDDGQPDWTAYWLMLEQLAQASASIALGLNHRLVHAEFLRRRMSAAQLEIFGKYLRDGQSVAGAISEPGGGSNPREMRTTARREGDHWVINGRKMWISSGTHADAAMVTCRTKQAGQPDRLASFFVERGQGWEARHIPMMGLTLNPLSEIVFADVTVPAIAEIKGGSDAMEFAKEIFLYGRMLVATLGVGLAQAALDAALVCAGTREQYGRKLGGFQLIQRLLANMATELDCGRLLLYRAMQSMVASNPSRRLHASMAKMYNSEMAVRATSAAVQIHGAMGLATEAGIERLFRDARMLTIPDGTTQIQELIIGRELTGLNALRG